MSSVTVTGTEGRTGTASRPSARLAVSTALHALLGFALALAAAVLLPAALGMSSFAVVSGSMAPTLQTGDVVVGRPLAAADARVGDVITFSAPDRENTLLTHRIANMRVLDSTVAFVTRGDANTGVERWTIPRDGSIARVVYRVPKLGYLTNRLGSRYGRLAFLVLPALLLMTLEVRRVWRR